MTATLAHEHGALLHVDAAQSVGKIDVDVPTRRVSNTLNVRFPGHGGTELLAGIPELAASTGSACHQYGRHSSPVLEAMGLPTEAIRGAVRLSVGRSTTYTEIDRAARLLAHRAALTAPAHAHR